MSEPCTAIIIGASAGVGRALSERLAQSGWRLMLAAREERDLAAQAAHLRLTTGADVRHAPLDLTAHPNELSAFVERSVDWAESLDAVFFVAGQVEDSDHDAMPMELTEQLVRVNFLSIILLADAYAKHMVPTRGGSLVFFTSIAAFVPRARNTVYASAKAALHTYACGLQHRYAGTAVRVSIVVPGYVDTTMSFGQALKLPAVKPEFVADKVVQAMEENVRCRFVPRYWYGIVAVLRCLPWCVYRRLRF